MLTVTGGRGRRRRSDDAWMRQIWRWSHLFLRKHLVQLHFGLIDRWYRRRRWRHGVCGLEQDEQEEKKKNF